jgi:antitoxin VapB
MSLNIKDEETHELVKQLAHLKGTSLTGAVKLAVRSALEREKADHEKNYAKTGLTSWISEMSRETAQIMNDGRTSKELMDELYDAATGLPK